jgi:hypothetical protein
VSQTHIEDRADRIDFTVHLWNVRGLRPLPLELSRRRRKPQPPKLTSANPGARVEGLTKLRHTGPTMLLTLTTTHEPATDLGYLLAKNPEKLQTFSLAYGRAHVFYPVATPQCCTAALLVEIDPVGLVRGRPMAGIGGIGQYVNDRPYVASSFTSVAIAQVFGSALGGRSRDRPELAETRIPLEVELEAVPCRGGESFLRRLFEPLDYRLEATRRDRAALSEAPTASGARGARSPGGG